MGQGRRPRTPKMTLHKPTGQARVRLRDAETGKTRDVYLGVHGSPGARREYDRVVAEWLSAGRRLEPVLGRVSATREPGAQGREWRAGMRVSELVGLYLDYAEGRYRDASGGLTTHYRNLCYALADLEALYGDKAAASVGPRALDVLRDDWVGRGFVRKTIRDRLGMIRGVFKWAVGRELLEPAQLTALMALEPLRRGERGVRESEAVRPASAEIVEGVRGALPGQVWDMVQVQRLTSVRPTEVCIMRPMDMAERLPIDVDGRRVELWVYRPSQHKNEFRGQERVVLIGPSAQAILLPYMDRLPHRYCFDPREAGGRSGMKAKAERWDRRSYATAIRRACDRVYPPTGDLERGRVKVSGRKGKRWETETEWRERLGPLGWAEVMAWRKAHRFHPHQLRHAAATAAYELADRDTAMEALGHADGRTADTYIEKRLLKAAALVARVG